MLHLLTCNHKNFEFLQSPSRFKRAFFCFFLFFFSPCRTFRMGLDIVFNTNLQLNNAEGMKRNI